MMQLVVVQQNIGHLCYVVLILMEHNLMVLFLSQELYELQDHIASAIHYNITMRKRNARVLWESLARSLTLERFLGALGTRKRYETTMIHKANIIHIFKLQIQFRCGRYNVMRPLWSANMV